MQVSSPCPEFGTSPPLRKEVSPLGNRCQQGGSGGSSMKHCRDALLDLRPPPRNIRQKLESGEALDHLHRGSKALEVFERVLILELPMIDIWQNVGVRALAAGIIEDLEQRNGNRDSDVALLLRAADGRFFWRLELDPDLAGIVPLRHLRKT